MRFSVILLVSLPDHCESRRRGIDPYCLVHCRSQSQECRHRHGICRKLLINLLRILKLRAFPERARTTFTLHIRLSLTRTNNMMDVKILGAILSVVAYYAFKLLSLGHRRAEMPPGPPTKPVIGNVHLMGSSGLFKVFQKWRVSTGSETDMAFDADFLPG